MTDTLLHDFQTLFLGRTDAYGLVHGQCVRMPVTDDCWRAHLFGEGSLGIYPVVPGGHILTGAMLPPPAPQVFARWACTDIDTHGPRAVSPQDALVSARNLVTALRVLGHTGWVELTKSGGYHVWLFADRWTDAKVMRNVMLLAHQLADVPVVEVNPKDAEGRTELGNYVNICYPWREPSETFRELDTREPGLGGWDHRGRGDDYLSPQGGSSNPGSDSGVHDGSGRDRTTPQPRWSGALTSPDPASVHGRTPQGPMGVGSPKHCGRCGTAVRHPAVVGLPTYEHGSYHPRRVVIDPLRPDSPLCVSCFVQNALDLRSTPAQLNETAGLYVPPAPRSPVTMRPFSGSLSAPVAGTYDHSKDIADGSLRNAVERLNGKGWIIFRDGPNIGGRGYTLFRLGVECRESGLSPDEALSVLVDADWRWGKYMSGVDGHTDGIRYIEKMIGDIYG